MITEKKYSGINHLTLGLSQLEYGYRSNNWLTFNQIREKKMRLKKGSKGEPIFFYSIADKKEKEGEKKGSYFFAKTYVVFNESCLEEFKEDETKITKEKLILPPSIGVKYLARESVELKQIDNNRAYYNSSKDIINLPPIENFKSKEGFNSTFFHEIIHSTGHESRLARFKNEKITVFKSEEYSKEELIAEMGACILSDISGTLNQYQAEQSADYIKGWSKYLKNKENEFVSAINNAMKAVDFVLKDSI